MLDAFIIDELRRREEEERRDSERPRLELPLEDDGRRAPEPLDDDQRDEDEDEDTPRRGVVIISL